MKISEKDDEFEFVYFWLKKFKCWAKIESVKLQ